MDNFRIINTESLEEYMTILQSNSESVYETIRNMINKERGNIGSLEKSLKLLEQNISLAKGLREQDKIEIGCALFNNEMDNK